jgi:hypothetical protein
MDFFVGSHTHTNCGNSDRSANDYNLCFNTNDYNKQQKLTAQEAF